MGAGQRGLGQDGRMVGCPEIRLRKKFGAIDGFVLGDGSEDARQGADAEGRVVRDTNALVAGLMGLKDQVTAGLMNQQILVIFTEMGGQSPA